MGLENFIPTIWSSKLFVRLQKALVFASLVDRQYEGEIRNVGDSVKINEIGKISVNDYTKYEAITWQKLDSAQKILTIDQAKSFSFTIDDIDTAQMNPKVMNAAMTEAAYEIADVADQYIASFYKDAGITNTTNMGSVTTAVTVTSGSVIKVLSFASRYMSENNVPQANRFIVVPPWFHQKLLLAEIGGISATAVPKVFDDGAMTSGYIGDALGFRVIVSNNVAEAATGVSAIMAFNNTAIAYAGQISKIEAVKRESYFDQGVKGLYLYGAKVVRPEALCTLYLEEGSE